jgi:hypothetical protein
MAHMLGFFRDYFRYVFLRMWFLCIISTLVAYVLQGWYTWYTWLSLGDINPFSVWKPSVESVAFPILLGLGFCGTLAWHEQFNENVKLASTSNMYSVKRTDEFVTIFKKQLGDTEIYEGRVLYRAKTEDLIVIDGIGPCHVGEMDDQVLVREFRQLGGIVPWKH